MAYKIKCDVKINKGSETRMKKVIMMFALLGCLNGATSAGTDEATDTTFNFDLFESPAPATRLSRMSMARIDAAHLYYRSRMRRIQATIYTTLLAGAVGIGAGVYSWKNRRQSNEEVKHLEELRDGLEKQITQDYAKGETPSPEPSNKEERKRVESRIKIYNERIARLLGKGPSQQFNGTFWGTVVGQPLKVALTLGLAGLVVTAGHQVFRVVSGTLGEVLQLWWHGYEYWYSSLEEQVRTLMNELRESFYQARKVAQQTSTEQQLVIARQQRRAPLAYEISSHYRLDIVTMYQRLIGAFERLVALMTIIAPSEHHDLMQQNIATIVAQCERLAVSLEADLNENTHGMLTHYSNRTLDLYHECAERMTIFLTTYRVYLRK